MSDSLGSVAEPSRISEMRASRTSNERTVQMGRVNSTGLSALRIQHLTQGKDKRVWHVSKDALVKMNPELRAKWGGVVLIEALTASRNKLVRDEFATMSQINQSLGLEEGVESNLALTFEKFIGKDGKEYYVVPKAVRDAEHAIHNCTFEQAMSFCSQFVNGMSNLHASGVSHNDLKPENLLVYEDGILRVADFGKSKPSDSKETYLGNPRFGPPEGKTSNAGDVYGSGLVLIRMLEEACFEEGETTLMEVATPKGGVHESRRGVERFVLESPFFTRSAETKEEGLLGTFRDSWARGKTIIGMIGSEKLANEERLLNSYIAVLGQRLVDSKKMSEEQVYHLKWLLNDMTQVNETRRPTMKQVQERFQAIVDSNFQKNPRLDPLYITPSKVSAFGAGKVNMVSMVVAEGMAPVVFKPEQLLKTSKVQKIWGAATLSGIPTDKQANFSSRAVASSIVDRLLYPNSPISVDTHFAFVDNQRGIIMEKALGGSPQYIGEVREEIKPEDIPLEATHGEEDLVAQAGFLGLDTLERTEDKKYVSGKHIYANFEPENPTTVEGLLKLQVVDWICGQVDRNPTNFLIDGKGKVTGIDQDASFGVRAAPRGVDVRRQSPHFGMPNNGSLMRNMPAVITKEIQQAVFALAEKREEIRESLVGLITAAEIDATLDRLDQLVEHINDTKRCIPVDNVVTMMQLAKEMQEMPESERLINSDNSYWGMLAYKLTNDEPDWNYLRYPIK